METVPEQPGLGNTLFIFRVINVIKSEYMYIHTYTGKIHIFKIMMILENIIMYIHT